MTRLIAKLGNTPTPKLGAADPSRSFYRYYAGFSEKFVQELLPLLAPDRSKVVLDPWNGAGTTTVVSARGGYRAVGVDRNPVLIAIATARGLPSKRVNVYLRELEELVRQPVEPRATVGDPLSNWFGPAFVAMFRGLQHKAFGDSASDRAEPTTRNAFSPAHSLAHLVFFRVARRLATPVIGSNPTWISRRPLARRISVSMARLSSVLDEEISALREHYFRFGNNSGLIPKIVLGDSTSLSSDLIGGPVGAIITSPPYGTRIDYAMAMGIELACLEPFATFDFKALRQQLIGTTLTSHARVEVTALWGSTAIKFLRKVHSHRSKASSAYYSRYYENYFAALYQSVGSIDSISRKRIPAGLVVQGSYYKEIYLDLASVIFEMFEGFGWEAVGRVDREVSTSFTLLNPASRYYPKTHRPIESVVVVQKA